MGMTWEQGEDTTIARYEILSRAWARMHGINIEESVCRDDSSAPKFDGSMQSDPLGFLKSHPEVGLGR